MDYDDSSTTHSRLFKNYGKNFESLRKDRNIRTVELRRDKRDEHIRKRPTDQIPLSTKGSKGLISTPEQAERLVSECASQNRDVAYQAVFNLRLHLTSKDELFLDHMLSLNIVDILANVIVVGETADVKYNAAWALTNIASGNSDHTSYLLKEAVIIALGQLVCDQNPLLVEQSIWALSNIMGDGPGPRLFVLRLDILSAVAQALNRHFDSLNVIKQLSWMLINVCRKRENEVPIEYVPQVIPLLIRILEHPEETVLADILWAITHLTDSSQNHITLLINSGIVDKVITFLGCNNKLVLSAVRVIGNVAASVDEHTQYLLDHNIYSHLQPLFSSPDQRIRKEIYWTLSNFAAGTREQMLTLFSLDIFPQIIRDLEEGEYIVRREACWVISNVLHSCTFAEAEPFVKSKVLYYMKKFLESKDPPIIMVVLEVVLVLLRLYSANNMMEYICQRIEESGVLDCIEAAQQHSNQSIKMFAHYILERYFLEDEELDEEEITCNFDQPNLPQTQKKYDF